MNHSFHTGYQDPDFVKYNDMSQFGLNPTIISIQGFRNEPTLFGYVYKNVFLPTYAYVYYYESSFLNETVRNELEKALKEKGVVYYKAWPAYQGKSEFISDIQELCRSKFTHEINQSIVLDVSEIENINSFLTSENRRKIKKAEELGVQIIQVHYQDHEYLKDIADLYSWKNKKEKIKWIKGRIFALQSKNYSCFVSLYEKKVLSVQFCVHSNDVVLLEGVRTSKYAKENRIYANELMQKFMIDWTKKRGCRYIDWVGAVPDSDDPKLRQILEYKLKWGGSLVKYPAFTKMLSPFKMLIFSKIRNLGRVIKKK